NVCDAVTMRVERPSMARSEGILEHRVDLDRHARAVAPLVCVGAHARIADDLGLAVSLREVPLDAAGLHRAPCGMNRLVADDQRGTTFPRCDFTSEMVDEVLRRVTAICRGDFSLGINSEPRGE